MKDYAKALKYYKEGFEYRHNINDKRGKGNNLAGMGEVYAEDSVFNLAIDMFRQALSLFTEIEDREGICITYNDLGDVYESQQMLDSAFFFYNKALNLALELGMKDDIADAYKDLGRTLYKQGKHNEGILYIQKAIDLADSIAVYDLKLDMLNTLAEIMEDGKDFYKAFSYKRDAYLLYEEINKNQHSHEITEMQTKYETAEKEKEIEMLEIEKRLNQRTKIFLIIGLIMIALLSVIIIYALRIRIRKKEADRNLTASKLELTKKELRIKQQELAHFTSVIGNKREEQIVGRNGEEGREASGIRI